MLYNLRQQLLAEFIGTFFLVFFGTGAIVVNLAYNGTIGHLGISVAFGLVVLCVIYAIGHISGAHLNPAVSFAFCLAKEISIYKSLWFSLAQILGAVVGSLSLLTLFPNTASLGETLPTNTIFQSIVTEFILSYFLMFVIINVAIGSKERGLLAGIAVGFAVLICALVGGPISGASMNPARSLGPAIVSGNLEHLWLYIVVPIFAMLCSIWTWRGLMPRR